MSKYEKDRLVAISSFFERLSTDNYYWDRISDELAELSSEISDNNGHVVVNFEKLSSDFSNDKYFYFFDKPTNKFVKVEFSFVDEKGDKNEV